MQQITISIPPIDRRGSEAYKTLRANLQFCGSDVKSIAITSCTSAEGKSTTSLNLAKSLADSGKRVLFIDADMRKSVLISRCRVQGAVRGLSHYLSGQAAFGDVVCSTNVSAMQSGIIYGYAGMVEKLISMIKKELKSDDVKVIATGGLATLIDSETDSIDYIDKDLTLEGLKIIYEKNKE